MQSLGGRIMYSNLTIPYMLFDVTTTVNDCSVYVFYSIFVIVYLSE